MTLGERADRQSGWAALARQESRGPGGLTVCQSGRGSDESGNRPRSCERGRERADRAHAATVS
jgi:hypothetical protein